MPLSKALAILLLLICLLALDGCGKSGPKPVPDPPRLQFRLVLRPTDPGPADEFVDPLDPGVTLRVGQEILADERFVARANYGQIDAATPAVEIRFTPAGVERFKFITQRNLNRRLAIVLDGFLLTAPSIRSTITESALIEGGLHPLTTAEAKQIASSINDAVARRPPPATKPARP